MSVIVKGMKMPKNCNECDFCHWSNLHQTGICDRCGDEPVCPDYGTDYRKTRARFCPLVELPEKHGRLIDADEFLKKMNLAIATVSVMMKALGAEDDAELQMELKSYRDIRDGIKEAPTIIEAEGDEE